MKTNASLLKDNPIVTSSVVFHCQQAIEKYFKAYLIENGWELQKTPDSFANAKEFYSIMPGVAAAGLGNSFSSIGDDLTILAYNPALLSKLNYESEIFASYAFMPRDDNLICFCFTNCFKE